MTPVYSAHPYTVAYDHGYSSKSFATFDEALTFYREHKGHGLVNEDRQCDEDNFAGLTEDERNRVIG